jgi:hypothetical protein
MKGLVLSKFTCERQNLHGKFLHSKSHLVRNASIYQYHTMQGTERYLPPMNIASKLGQRFRAQSSASPASSAIGLPTSTRTLSSDSSDGTDPWSQSEIDAYNEEIKLFNVLTRQILN